MVGDIKTNTEILYLLWAEHKRGAPITPGVLAEVIINVIVDIKVASYLTIFDQYVGSTNVLYTQFLLDILSEVQGGEDWLEQLRYAKAGVQK